MLTINGLRAGYGAGEVLKGVSMQVAEGECVAVLGANGAGKTTLLRAISGLIVRYGGEVRMRGAELSLQPHAVAAAGIAHVPEGRGTIPGLTVEENLLVGGYLQRNAAELRRDLAQAYERFPVLHRYRRRHATDLSGGEQQMLAISRALMSRPALLLLDEPSFGLAPKIVQEVYEAIGRIVSDAHLAVLLVEQSTDLAMGTASRAYVLKDGAIAGAGDIAALVESDELRQMYLGKEPARA